MSKWLWNLLYKDYIFNWKTFCLMYIFKNVILKSKKLDISMEKVFKKKHLGKNKDKKCLNEKKISWKYCYKYEIKNFRTYQILSQINFSK